MLQFVITGTGRSGTMWAAQALTAAGLPCAHEFTCSSWMDDYSDDQIWRTSPPGLLGESSWQAAPFVEEMQAAGVRVIHLVRHPLEVVSSMVTNDMLAPGPVVPWHHFIETHIGDHLWRLHPHDRALRFWIDWNKQIETPHLRWHMPVGAREFDGLAMLLGRTIDPYQVEKVPKDVNHWKPVTRLDRRDFVESIYDEAMDLWRFYEWKTHF